MHTYTHTKEKPVLLPSELSDLHLICVLVFNVRDFFFLFFLYLSLNTLPAHKDSLSLSLSPPFSVSVCVEKPVPLQ